MVKKSMVMVNNQWKFYDEPTNHRWSKKGSMKGKPLRSYNWWCIGYCESIFYTSTKHCCKDRTQWCTPVSKARLSGEDIVQLKLLQELCDSGILRDEEFLEQKSFVLDNIRSMNTRKSIMMYTYMCVISENFAMSIQLTIMHAKPPNTVIRCYWRECRMYDVHGVTGLSNSLNCSFKTAFTFEKSSSTRYRSGE